MTKNQMLSPGFKSFLLVVTGGGIIFMLAYIGIPLAEIDGVYQHIFWGGDSFFHAARILQTAENPAGFFEYDIQSNTYISWPWGYDWLIGSSLYVLRLFNHKMDLQSALVNLPPLMGFLNFFLFTGFIRLLNLRRWLFWTAIVLFCLLPMTRYLHIVGRIDHHMLELSFVLAALWSGTLWFQNMQSRKYAIVHAAVLALAHLVHNSLFILQLPTLITLFCLWIYGNRPVHIKYFCVTLCLTLMIILLPSRFFREMSFDYRFLSWFHLYISFCVAGLAFLMNRIEINRKSLMIVIATSALLSLPLLPNILHGYFFVSGNLSGIRNILEVKSPLSAGFAMFPIYGLFVIFAPAALIALALWVRDKPAPERIYIGFGFLMGITILFGQIRFYYFGYFALFLPYLMLVNDRVHKRGKQGMIQASLAGVLLVMALPAIPTTFKNEDLAGMRYYYYLHPQMMELKRQCEQNPGLVFAPPDVGHLIRYFTKCRVNANMMLITAHDFKKQDDYYRLLGLNLEDFLKVMPDVDYIFLHRTEAVYADIPMEEKIRQNRGIRADLMLGNKKIPDNLELLHNHFFSDTGSEKKMDAYPIAVLYKVHKLTK